LRIFKMFHGLMNNPVFYHTGNLKLKSYRTYPETSASPQKVKYNVKYQHCLSFLHVKCKKIRN